MRGFHALPADVDVPAVPAGPSIIDRFVAKRAGSVVTPDDRDLTPEQRTNLQHKAGLQLALAETQAQMGAACRPAHREMLKLRLEAIHVQLKDL